MLRPVPLCKILLSVLTGAVCLLVAQPIMAEADPVARQQVLFSYLGEPVTFAAQVEASCYDEKQSEYIRCHFSRDENGRYWIDRLPPGRYGLNVSVDENAANPPRRPGDYHRYYQFSVGQQTGSKPLRVSMQKLINMTAPADNNAAVDGIGGPCGKKPYFEVPLASILPETKVEFAWHPLAPDVIYHYTLWRANCNKGGMSRLIYRQTNAMQVTETLPANRADEYYLFRITAVKNGEMVGNFSLHDTGGSYMPQYRFRITDPLGNRYYIYYGLAGVFILGLLVLRTRVRRIERQQKAVVSRAGSQTWKNIFLVIMVPATVTGVYYGYGQYQQHQAGEAEVKARASQEQRQSHLRAEFEFNVPLPDWWDNVSQPRYLFDTHSDIVSVWPKINYARDGLESRREIIKRCYLSIVAHTDDNDLVASCLNMIASLEEDREIVLMAAEFGVAHYFNHKHRTDYCVGCRPGDSTAGLVSRAASNYNANGDYDRSIELITRFLEAREAETAPYKLASLYASLGNAYWQRGDRRKAVELLEAAKVRFGDKNASGYLQYYLDRYSRLLSGEG